MKNLSLENIIESIKNPDTILGRGKYFNSAVLIPLIKINEELHILFEKRSGSIRQGGEVSFPGGEFDSENDKSFEDTAVRESVEELGINNDKIKVLGRLGTYIAPMGVSVEPFIGLLNIENISVLKIDTNEVEKVFTVPISYFINTRPDEYPTRFEIHTSYVNEDGRTIELFPVKQLGLPERYSLPWRSEKHRVLIYPPVENPVNSQIRIPEEIIWGITAEIIFEFSKIIVNKK